METGFWVLDETIFSYTYRYVPTTTNNSSPWMFYVPTPMTLRSLPRLPRSSFSTYRYQTPAQLLSQRSYNEMTDPITVDDDEQNLLHSQSLNGRSVGSGLSQKCISDYLLRSLGHLTTKENLICSICQGEIQGEEETSTLRCSHMYHAGCIGEWLMIKNECPVCRASVINPEEDIGRALN